MAQSWQHRFLGPLLVAGLDSFTSDRLTSLTLFCALPLSEHARTLLGALAVGAAMGLCTWLLREHLYVVAR